MNLNKIILTTVFERKYMYAIQKICLFMLLPVLHAGAASSALVQSATEQKDGVIRVVVPETLGLSAAVVTDSMQSDIQIRAGVALHADETIARRHATHQLHLSCGATCKDPALLAGLITLTASGEQVGGFMLMYRIKSGFTTIDTFNASDRDALFVALAHHEALSSNPKDLYTHFKDEAAWRAFLTKERCVGIELNYAALRQK